MDEQALTAFKKNLQALFRSTEHISSNEVNLTDAETVFLS
jgi:hypothetical protein